MKSAWGAVLVGAVFSPDMASIHGPGQRPRPPAPWTVMIYGGVDSTAESYILPQLAALKNASRAGLSGEVVLLMDRVEGASNDWKTLGEDFDDTRLFRLIAGDWDRIEGGLEFPGITRSTSQECNTGDARTLKKFVQFVKREFPAKRYALLLFGHGETRSLCPDTSSVCADSGEFEDPLFTAEITEVLTPRESVDVLWVDACSFGAVENAYQFRPGTGRFCAQVLLTAATLSPPAPMSRILYQCGILRSSPIHEAAPTAAAFGHCALKAITESLSERRASKRRMGPEVWGCYDLRYADAVKQAVDRLAAAVAEDDGRRIIEDLRGWNTLGQARGRQEAAAGSKQGITLSRNYLYADDPLRWVISAHFDLYDLARRIRNDARLSEAIRTAAAEVAMKVDAMVLASAGSDAGPDFQPGRHGLYIVFPGGEMEVGGSPVWSFFRWYHPADQRTLRTAFGNYDWCRDGAVPGNGRVENWFELLDSWLDVQDENGGMNLYRW